MRLRTSKTRRHRHHVKVLKAEVMSPRIAWFSFLHYLRALGKFCLILGVLLAAGYGIRSAVQHTFHRNPDFQLKAINLNSNDALDEAGLVEALRIDLAANIFDFDVDAMEEKLMERHEISSARVERKLPGTLDFRITTRKPAAWIACPADGFPATRDVGSLLVDHDGFAYRCPPGQAEAAHDLPILALSGNSDHPVRAGGIVSHPQYERTLRLLSAVVSECPEELPMVDSISQASPWALNLVTRGGTVATFGLGDHARQLGYLRDALDHARRQGYDIESINLIPKRNVPITVGADAAPPRAIPVDPDSLGEAPASNSRTEDLRTLLNRN